MLMQVYGGGGGGGRRRRRRRRERDQDDQQRAELKKTLQKFVKLCVEIIDLLCQDHSRVREHRQGNT
jgi:hypothetical protein